MSIAAPAPTSARTAETLRDSAPEAGVVEAEGAALKEGREGKRGKQGWGRELGEESERQGRAYLESDELTTEEDEGAEEALLLEAEEEAELEV